MRQLPSVVPRFAIAAFSVFESLLQQTGRNRGVHSCPELLAYNLPYTVNIAAPYISILLRHMYAGATTHTACFYTVSDTVFSYTSMVG